MDLRAPIARPRARHSSPGLLAAVLLGGAMVGCGPADAPPEINEVSHRLYREFDNADPKVLQAALADLESLLAQHDLTTSGLEGRAWEMQPLSREDLANVPQWPSEQNPADTRGASVARESPWPTTDHARIQASPDQLAVEPTATAYTRDFVDPTDPSCFVDRSCALLKTENTITRENALLKATFITDKNFRWVELADGRPSIVSRGVMPTVTHGEKGTLVQSYTLDVWIGRPEDKSWRYQWSLSQTELPIYADPGIELALVTGALDDLFKRGDSVINKRYHGGM